MECCQQLAEHVMTQYQFDHDEPAHDAPTLREQGRDLCSIEVSPAAKAIRQPRLGNGHQGNQGKPDHGQDRFKVLDPGLHGDHG